MHHKLIENKRACNTYFGVTQALEGVGWALPTLPLSIIVNNKALAFQGSFSVAINNQGFLQVSDSNIRGNKARDGGGIYNLNGIVDISSSSIESNIAQGEGNDILNIS